MEKTLSISIAAYNVEKFLKNTLDSLAAPEIIDDIEVLIVDDGSKDNTAAIGKEFENKHPNSFKVISKPNGGYGSTINAAVEAATGRYFKTLDGDDWYDTQHFTNFVQKLKEMDADLIITPFTMVHDVTNEKEIVSCNQTVEEKNIAFEQLPPRLHPKIRMHAVTYKTSLLKDHQIHIGEHCFYTDIEYIAFPMIYVNDVNFLDFSVYQYRIGLEGQSVSLEGFQKHYKDHLNVIKRVLAFYTEHKGKGLSKEKDAFLFRILKDLISMQYRIFLSMENQKQIRQELIDFDNEIKEKNRMLYEAAAGKKINILRKTNFKLYGLLSFYSKLKE